MTSYDPSSSGIARSDAEEQRNCKEQRRAETDPNCGAGLGRAWQRHGTEEPSDGIAQLREGTEERRSAGYEQQRQGMAVKGAKRNGRELHIKVPQRQSYERTEA